MIAQAAGVKSTPARVVITARSILTSIIVCGSSKEAIVWLGLGIKDDSNQSTLTYAVNCQGRDMMIV